MTTRIASLLILAPAVVLSYVICVLGQMIPFLFWRLYSASSLEEAQTLMPGVTRFAVDHSWAFVALIALICVAAIRYLYRAPEKASQLTAGACCGLGLVTWTAMFCYCYNGFTGPMCLHHGPEFELTSFLLLGGGVFPVTLAVLTALGAAVFSPRSTRKQ